MRNPTEQIPLLELDLLKTLVAIAETGNFSAAAEVVFRTPSAVSMQVKKIEDLLGRPVFRRDSRSVSTTAEGELLLEHGRRMLALNRELVARFVQPDIAGVVRLGAPDDMAERSLPELLRRFAESHCCITVDVVVDSSSNLAKMVSNGDLDVALVTCDPNQKQPDREIVFRERLAWAGAKNGVAYEQDPLPVSVWEEGCAWRRAGLSSLESSSRSYRVAFMSAHISGQRAAILADLAVAPIPISSCNNGIVELTEKHGLPPVGDYALAIMVTDDPSDPAVAAADHFRACFARLQ